MLLIQGKDVLSNYLVGFLLVCTVQYALKICLKVQGIKFYSTYHAFISQI